MAKKRIATRDELDNHVSKFEDWRREHPGRPARDWYSEQRMQAHLRGEMHSTIGGNLRGGEFERAGRDEFQELVNHGLQPNHLCVDFGCGTLRVGQHLIRYLAPGAYWGLDIAEHLLDTGRSLIGSDLIAEKKPNLRVISSDSVAEVASKRPQMLFSLKVMQHIHPEELREYLENVEKNKPTPPAPFFFQKMN